MARALHLDEPRVSRSRPYRIRAARQLHDVTRREPAPGARAVRVRLGLPLSAGRSIWRIRVRLVGRRKPARSRALHRRRAIAAVDAAGRPGRQSKDTTGSIAWFCGAALMIGSLVYSFSFFVLPCRESGIVNLSRWNLPRSCRNRHRPRALESRRHRPRDRVLQRRAGVRSDHAARRPGGVRIRRRLSSPHRPEHLAEPRRLSRSSTPHRPLSLRNPLPDAARSRTRGAPRHRRRRSHSGSGRPRRERVYLSRRSRRQRHRAHARSARSRVAARPRRQYRPRNGRPARPRGPVTGDS